MTGTIPNNATSIGDGYFKAKKNNLYGIFNSNGDEFIPYKYRDIQKKISPTIIISNGGRGRIVQGNILP